MPGGRIFGAHLPGAGAVLLRWRTRWHRRSTLERRIRPSSLSSANAVVMSPANALILPAKAKLVKFHHLEFPARAPLEMVATGGGFKVGTEGSVHRAGCPPHNFFLALIGFGRPER